MIFQVVAGAESPDANGANLHECFGGRFRFALIGEIRVTPIRVHPWLRVPSFSYWGADRRLVAGLDGKMASPARIPE
jgi:hypothetical protein